MPRRSSARASNLLSASNAFLQLPEDDPAHDDLILLRRQWRWAAFSQFFYTFYPLFSMDDVSIADIEKDLVHHSNNVISRIMQKLLYSLSYDRKVSVDNWQHALRKQYIKRDPAANPLGLEARDPSHPAKHEEEPSSVEIQPSVANSVNNEENGGEHAQTASREASQALETVAAEVAASEQPNDTRSRQSSVAVTRAGSKAKDVEGENEEEPAKPVDWFDLPTLVKLETIHTLSEWQFQNPTRLRTIMKSDDETASWRIEPIGYDSKLNAYWFIGDRLWIQRVPPKAPRAPKRKRAPEKKSTAKTASTPAKRVRLTVAAPPTPSTPSGRHSRAAKDQAKLKLDMQAKEMAELNRQVNGRSTRATRQAAPRATTSKSAPAATTSTRSTRSLGTRASARLRGPQEEDEWQPIPEEWLNEGKRNKASKPAPAKTGLESDEESISDLTDLSDDGAEGSAPAHSDKEEEEEEEEKKEEEKEEERPNGVEKHEETADEKEVAARQEPEDPLANFIEWETICVTLYEWEHVAERFEKATHYTEKALYKVLVNDIVPYVVAELREIVKKREIEEALVHRKKSSRLAIRESEREEARQAAKMKQEEEEKMSRARRLEVRLQKDEAERLRREKAREQRRQEREAREESRKAQTTASLEPKSQSPPPQPEPEVAPPKSKQTGEKRAQKASAKARTQKGSRTAGEDWELDCEICQRRGISLDDGVPMMSCGRCSKWQHIPCHDRADKEAGRAPRNWNAVDFFCRSCRAAQYDRRDYYPVTTQHPSIALNHNVPQMQPYRSYQQPAPIDPANSHYMASYRDSAHHQSYYVRPPTSMPPQGSYAVTTPYAASSRSQEPSSHGTISFSHYQPAAHGFSNAQKAHPDPRYTYDTSNHQPYHNAAQQYTQHPQSQYRTEAPSAYKPPVPSVPAWSGSAAAHAPGYPVAYGGAIQPNSSNYRAPPVEGAEASRNPAEQAHPSSYARYAEPPYPSTQFKHHPTSSYQPPLGR